MEHAGVEEKSLEENACKMTLYVHTFHLICVFLFQKLCKHICIYSRKAKCELLTEKSSAGLKGAGLKQRLFMVVYFWGARGFHLSLLEMAVC